MLDNGPHLSHGDVLSLGTFFPWDFFVPGTYWMCIPYLYGGHCVHAWVSLCWIPLFVWRTLCTLCYAWFSFMLNPLICMEDTVSSREPGGESSTTTSTKVHPPALLLNLCCQAKKSGGRPSFQAYRQAIGLISGLIVRHFKIRTLAQWLGQKS